MEILLVNIFAVLIEAIIIKILISKRSNAVKVYLLVVFTQLFILHAFLDPNKMVDLPGYLEYYEVYARNSLHESIVIGYVGVKMEPGWIVFCKFLSFISTNPRIILIVTSLIIVGSYCITIRKYSLIPWLSVFLFLCTTFDQSLYVIRQHSAMAISLLGIPYIIHQKLKKYLFVIICASLFHSTAIIMFPLYFLYQMKLNKSFVMRYLIVIVIGWYFANAAFDWLFNNTWYNGYAEKEGSNLTEFFISLCIVLLALFSYNWKISSFSGVNKLLILMMFLSIAFAIWGAGFSPTNRLIKYYTVASVFLIPNSIARFSDFYFKVAAISIVIIMYLMLFHSNSNLEYIKDYTLQII